MSVSDSTPNPQLPLDHEEWRDLPGYEGHYQVSSMGSVRSLDRTDIRGHKIKGRIFKCGCIVSGYRTVIFTKFNKDQRFLVHRLVTLAFIGPCPEGRQVNHKDGDKLNNAASNLEYVTPRENVAHAYATGLTRNRGEDHHHARFTVEDVLDIRRRVAQGEPQRSLARFHNASPAAINEIINRATWKHV